MWIHASNAARFEQSFWETADQVKIPGRQNPDVNIFKLVENWLRDEKRGKWVLILDNVDDDGFLHNPPSTGQDGKVGRQCSRPKPLVEYLPQSPNGSIIFTTRNRAVALRLVNPRCLVEIQPMNELDALALLQKKLGSPEESEHAMKLVEALEYIPLAIVQAASYIRARTPRCSVLQYLEQFQKSHHATALLHYEAGYFYRDWEANNSILLTWQISFDHIRQFSKSAADLLSLMSFFDRQGIPEHVLCIPWTKLHQPPHMQPLMPNTNNTGQTRRSRLRRIFRLPFSDGQDAHRISNQKQPKVEIESVYPTSPSKSHSRECNQVGVSDVLCETFEDDIQTLRDFSFVYISQDPQVFEMHRLVQLATGKWLETQGISEKWKRQFIKNLCYSFPTGQYESWDTCQLLFPHLKLAVSQRPDLDDSVLYWAELLYRGARYALGSGRFADAREMASKSRDERAKILGIQDEQALASTTILAIAYRLSGEWEEAARLQVQVMEAHKTKLGENHPETLRAVGNLAITYVKQGRWDEAEPLQKQVMENHKIQLGNDHPDTLQGISNLAAIYGNQGRWDKAEYLQVQVMEARKAKLGKEHLDTLWSISDLAVTYGNQGRWDEAEYLQKQVMETYKAKLGKDHPDTLWSINNLSITYGNQGRWDEAENLQVQVMETRKTKLGEDHPQTLRSIDSLAVTYSHQGRWDEAEHLQKQVMETCKAKLGEDHPQTLANMASLAFTWKSTGRTANAINLLRTCVAKQRQMIGFEHPTTVFNSKTLLEWETEELAINS